MKKHKYTVLYIFLLLLADVSAFAQSRFIDRQGSASFYSEAPIENIDAHSKEAMSIIDIKTGEIVASVAMKSFEFEKSLMQEHFNENYVESDKYPTASFKGKIADMTNIDLTKDGTYRMDVDGDMTIHGVTKPLQCKVEIKKAGQSLTATTSFPIQVADFDIDIPKVVFYNIAEVVDVKIAFSYKPLNP